jgi:hypothetical protein
MSLFENEISVIMVNHIRPTNFAYQLPRLQNMSIIKDIVIIHTNPETYTQFNTSKVTNIMAFFYEDVYGPAQRYFFSSMVQAETILFLDDDNAYSEAYLNQVYTAFTSPPLSLPRIAGSTRRSCSKQGYHNSRLPEEFVPLRRLSTEKNEKTEPNEPNENKPSRVGVTAAPSVSSNHSTIFTLAENPNMIILTHFLMISKSTMLDYLKFGFPVWQHFLKENHGNCEDLSLNLFVKNFYSHSELIHVPPTKGQIYTLNGSSGMQKRKNHYLKRQDFCRTYADMQFNQTREANLNQTT